MTLETLLSRHGEPAVHGILENWERFIGLRREAAASLEDRWQAFMAEAPRQPQYAMA